VLGAGGRLGGAGQLEEVWQVQPHLARDAAEPRGIRRRLVDAGDAKGLRARAVGGRGEAHRVADRQAVGLGKLARDEDPGKLLGNDC
jgi:hypothetical protein